MQSLGKRQASGKGHFIGMICFAAAVHALDENFDSPGTNAGFLQHGAQGHAGPFRVANGPRGPLDTVGLGLQKGTPIAGAFDGGKDGSFGESRQLLPGPRFRPIHTPFYFQVPIFQVDRRDVEMVADKKQSVGGDPAPDRLQGGFTIFGFRRDEFALLRDVWPFR